MKGFLAGVGVGFALGLLFAPMRGADVREMAAVRASEIADSARERYGQARDLADKAVSSVRNIASQQGTGTQG